MEFTRAIDHIIAANNFIKTADEFARMNVIITFMMNMNEGDIVSVYEGFSFRKYDGKGDIPFNYKKRCC